MIAAVLVRFADLAVSQAFASPWLLRMSKREKDIEILELRHQLEILRRQLGDPRLRPEDRTLLAVWNRLPYADRRCAWQHSDGGPGAGLSAVVATASAADQLANWVRT